MTTRVAQQLEVTEAEFRASVENDRLTRR